MPQKVTEPQMEPKNKSEPSTWWWMQKIWRILFVNLSNCLLMFFFLILPLLWIVAKTVAAAVFNASDIISDKVGATMWNGNAAAGQHNATKAKMQPVFSQSVAVLAPLHPLYVLSFLTLFSFRASAVKSISSLHKRLSAANFAPLMGTGALCVPGQHQVGGMHSHRCSNACPFSP